MRVVGPIDWPAGLDRTWPDRLLRVMARWAAGRDALVESLSPRHAATLLPPLWVGGWGRERMEDV